MPAPDPILLFLYITALIAACGFVGAYATNRPWRTELGGAMLSLAIAFILVVLSGILLTVLGPNYPFRGLVRVLVALGLNIPMWWQLCILLRVQHDRYQPPSEPNTTPLPSPRTPSEAQDNELVD